MSVVQTLIGNIKGVKGDTGAQGQQGIQGEAATIEVGSVTTTTYGNPARVTNSGTSSEAVFDFVIPQGRPGEQTTKIDNLTIDAITEPATEFPVPAVGDNGSTLFGKISKWFSDMTALVATKLNASNVVNNLTTTASGYALDARQGKALSDKLGSYNYTNGSSLWNGSINAGSSKTINITQNGLCCVAEMYTSENLDFTVSTGVPFVTVNVNSKMVFATQSFVAKMARTSGTIFPVKSGDTVSIVVANKDLTFINVRFVPANF